MKKLTFLLSLCFLLVACEKENNAVTDTMEQNDSTVIVTTGEIDRSIEYNKYENSDDNFKLKLFVENKVYAPEEPIHVYASIEYIGEDEEITIKYGKPYMQFEILGDNGFNLSAHSFGEELQMTIQKNTIYEFALTRSGYLVGEIDEEMYEVFYRDEYIRFVEGTYDVRFRTDFSYLDYSSENFMSVQTTIVVIE